MIHALTISLLSDAVGGHHPHPVGLTFRILQVDPDDELRLAQLVLRRRRIARHPHPLHRKLLPPPYRVRVFEIVDTGGRIRTVPLASIPVPQVKITWIITYWLIIRSAQLIKKLLLSLYKFYIVRIMAWMGL